MKFLLQGFPGGKSACAGALILAAAFFEAVPDASAVTSGFQCNVVFAVQKTTALGSMGWSVDYSGTSGWIKGGGSDPVCQNLVPGGMTAFHDDDQKHVLGMALIADPAVSTPRTLASCVFLGLDAPSAADFAVSVWEANDTDIVPIVPLPVVYVSGVSCVTSNSLTTTTTISSTTSTTTEPADCPESNIVFRLHSASSPVGHVQFRIDYSSADGVFPGTGSGVECQNLVSGALFAPGDDDSSRTLLLGLIALTPIQAPANLATCRFTSQSAAFPFAGDFAVTVEDAGDADVRPISVVISPSVVPTGTSTPCETRCGDGTSAGNEGCDDGNVSNTDGCLTDCTLARCGDGFVRAGVETCDDGNFSSGDACPNTCVPARCGDGFVRAGTEQCDDGNLSNADSCLNSCLAARCGDGFIRTGFEQCDDGNVSSTDACLNNCLNATCGDGYVRSGMEECDDGNASDTDACLDACVSARCGDGVVRTNVEECDDGNVLNGDGCSVMCDITQTCGDPNDDGRILVGDALRTLQRAVGLDVECPDWTCDINGDGSVSVSDSLVMLRASVGLSVVRNCGPPTALVIRLTTPSLLAGLQVDVDYSRAGLSLTGDGAAVECTGMVPGASNAFNDKATGVLSASTLMLNGFAGPRSIARCKLTPSALYDPARLLVKILDARSIAGEAVPGVQVRAIPY